MYSKPLVVGVKQTDHWPATHTIEQVLAELGQNSGNRMFTEALLRVVGSASWAPFSFTEQDTEGRDAIVLAAANWVNSYDDLGWLATRLEATKLPVFLIGVGAQASTAREVPNLKPGTLRLLRLVQDRSVSIAARGAFSCEVLASYGFKNTVATGCPSLMLAGPQGLHIRQVGHVLPQTCCVHSTRHSFNPGDSFQNYLYRQALKHQLDIVLQSELADIYVALGKAESPTYQRAADTLRAVYAVDDLSIIEQYLKGRSHIFLNYGSWIDYMKTRSFSFGTRFHCTVASIIAGTPATLIAHDSRTLEMAEAMSIPRLNSSSIAVDKDLCLDTLLLPEQITSLVDGYQAYYLRFLRYLDMNSLPITASYRRVEDDGAPSTLAEHI
jgi:hypothetical protein